MHFLTPHQSFGEDLPSYEEIDDDQQQQEDDKSVVSSCADSQHTQSDTISIIIPAQNTGVDVEI